MPRGPNLKVGASLRHSGLWAAESPPHRGAARAAHAAEAALAAPRPAGLSTALRGRAGGWPRPSGWGPLAALALLATCRRAPPPPAPDPAPSASSPRPSLAPLTPLAPGDAAALWGRPRGSAPGAERTFFVDSAGSLLDQRPGVFLFRGGELFRLTIASQTSAGERCPGGSEPFPVRVLHRSTLAPARGTEPGFELLPYPPPGQPSPAEQLHVPVGGLGPFVFLASQTVSAPCGQAPPRYRSEFFAWELRDRPIAVPLDELSEGSEAGLDEALSLLNQDTPRGLAPGDPDAAVDRSVARVTLVAPALSPEGLGWTAQYTAPASWIRGRGGWGSHTRSVRVRLPSFPRRAEPEARMPEPALRFVREHSSFDFLGVSVGPRSSAPP